MTVAVAARVPRAAGAARAEARAPREGVAAAWSSTRRPAGAIAPGRPSSPSHRGVAAGAGAGPSGSSRISRRRRWRSSRPSRPRTRAVSVRSGSTVKEVAESLQLSSPEVIKKLMELGEMATLTQTLSDDAIAVLAEAFDKKVDMVGAAEAEDDEPVFEDSDEDLVDRPPVITIMGHVDHGKTSLLDAIRQTEVAAGEAGGITQHIGAYQVHHDGHTITFLDTPGHEAFTAMRARGAKVTDIAVIVVAADDGVMPQTVEAIDHAKAAEVPVMVAVNKIDKEGADPNRVRGELAQQGLTPADWGGDTEFVDVSAKTRQNLDDLLETLVTLAEIQELKANPDTAASGFVIESKLDPGRGAVVTLLVHRGRMKVGDAIVAGQHQGRVKAMNDYRGERVQEATPGMPVEILGFDGVPGAGEHFRVVENDREARRRRQRARHPPQAGGTCAPGDAARVARGRSRARGARREGAQPDHQGRRGRIARGARRRDRAAPARAGDRQHHPRRRGWNLRVGRDARLRLRRGRDRLQRAPGRQRRTGGRPGGRRDPDLLGDLQDLRGAAGGDGGMLEAVEVEEEIARVEVRATFKASRVGTIAGSYVVSGTVRRGAKCRLVRDGTVIYEGRIGSLRRFKDDVREVTVGMECGIVLENYPDPKEGDVIEVYETKQVEQTLT